MLRLVQARAGTPPSGTPQGLNSAKYYRLGISPSCDIHGNGIARQSIVARPLERLYGTTFTHRLPRLGRLHVRSDRGTSQNITILSGTLIQHNAVESGVRLRVRSFFNEVEVEGRRGGSKYEEKEDEIDTGQKSSKKSQKEKERRIAIRLPEFRDLFKKLGPWGRDQVQRDLL